ncbi:MAG: DUF4112 domain-containing protein [Cyanobacteria bacterium J06632_22]
MPTTKPMADLTSRSGTLLRLRRLSHVLDNAIPIPGVGRVGLDPILGLLPGGGDILTGAISIYVVFEAARLGVPAATLGRMGLNILADVLSGTVPLLGDLVDVAWKANARNVALLEKHIESPRESGRADKIFAVLLIAALIALILAVASLSFMIVRGLMTLVT